MTVGGKVATAMLGDAIGPSNRVTGLDDDRRSPGDSDILIGTEHLGSLRTNVAIESTVETEVDVAVVATPAGELLVPADGIASKMATGSGQGTR